MGIFSGLVDTMRNRTKHINEAAGFTPKAEGATKAKPKKKTKPKTKTSDFKSNELDLLTDDEYLKLKEDI